MHYTINYSNNKPAIQISLELPIEPIVGDFIETDGVRLQITERHISSEDKTKGWEVILIVKDA